MDHPVGPAVLSGIVRDMLSKKGVTDAGYAWALILAVIALAFGVVARLSAARKGSKGARLHSAMLLIPCAGIIGTLPWVLQLGETVKIVASSHEHRRHCRCDGVAGYPDVQGLNARPRPPRRQPDFACRMLA